MNFVSDVVDVCCNIQGDAIKKGYSERNAVQWMLEESMLWAPRANCAVEGSLRNYSVRSD